MRHLAYNENWLERAWLDGKIEKLPKARWLWRISEDNFKTHCNAWEKEYSELF